MTEVLIHLGAHRTGTSTLQKSLSLNQSALLQSGVQTVIPPYSRQINPEDIHIDQPKFLISEENMLGTMENNLWQEGLYPDAQKQLQRYQNLMADSDKILFSIRNYVDFWTSVFFFCAKSQNILLTKDKLEELQSVIHRFPNFTHDTDIIKQWSTLQTQITDTLAIRVAYCEWKTPVLLDDNGNSSFTAVMFFSVSLLAKPPNPMRKYHQYNIN